MEDYIEINLANWNSRVPHHVEGYRTEAFRRDPQHLSNVVRFDLPRLGDLRGLDVLHLQCHIGTDTISLARLGAASVTGLDFSQPALDAAAMLAVESGVDARWVCGDVYAAPDAVGSSRYDLVYTGVGALCWLPDVRRWARVVAELLRPGGRLFIREGHPMLWALSDPRDDQLLAVEFPYFEVEGGTTFHETTTYVDHEGELDSPDTVQFNHGIGEIITAVADAGMTLVSFDEHTSVPWNAFGDAMVLTDLDEYELRDRPERLAASYTLVAVKR